MLIIIIKKKKDISVHLVSPSVDRTSHQTHDGRLSPLFFLGPPATTTVTAVVAAELNNFKPVARYTDGINRVCRRISSINYISLAAEKCNSFGLCRGQHERAMQISSWQLMPIETF